MTTEQIIGMVDNMEGQVKSLKYTALQMSWNMRGGVSYEDAMLLSSDEREMISKIIKENLEVTKKSGLPYF